MKILPVRLVAIAGSLGLGIAAALAAEALHAGRHAWGAVALAAAGLCGWLCCRQAADREQALRAAREELERRVAERTRQLAESNAGLQREIDERRRIADALKNSRALYQSLLENLPVHVWRTDLEGRYTYGNEHLCDCLGVAPEGFAGRCAHDFYTPATAEHHARQDLRVLASGDPLEAVEAYELTDGRRGYAQVLRAPCLDGAGRMAGVQVFSWDVTARHQAEEELRHTKEELERANADLRRKAEEIQNFYHTLSHELKTPLTSAREFICILMDGLAGPLNATQLEYLGIARQSCNQLRVCINDLLDATRLETGKLHLELQPASLAVLAARVVTLMGPVAARREIALECQADPDVPAVPLDEHRVTQVLTNLLNNALKFTPAGGRITVRVGESRAHPGFVEAAVRDTGRGIAPEQRGRIFDRLYQVHSGDAATGQGVGLGLYICRELARLHGGDIHVESAEGRGSTFTLTLPKDADARRARVLVVEDDPALRDLLREVLERADFNVTGAADGAAALQAMRRQAPDLVLLDLHMPGQDGAATLRDIRRHWGQVPVIIHTGHPDGDLMSRAMEFSPFTLLAKPCPPERLVRTVRALNQHHHGGRPRAVASPTAPAPELESVP